MMSPMLRIKGRQQSAESERGRESLWVPASLQELEGSCSRPMQRERSGERSHRCTSRAVAPPTLQAQGAVQQARMRTMDAQLRHGIGTPQTVPRPSLRPLRFSTRNARFNCSVTSADLFAPEPLLARGANRAGGMHSREAAYNASKNVALATMACIEDLKTGCSNRPKSSPFSFDSSILP